MGRLLLRRVLYTLTARTGEKSAACVPDEKTLGVHIVFPQSH
jgi:hypothetical protein